MAKSNSFASNLKKRPGTIQYRGVFVDKVAVA